MTENRYRVVLSGGVRQGESLDAVKQRMAAMFKAPAAQMDMLFQRGHAVIKKDIDLETAKKYVRAIESAGALCEIEPQESAAEPARPAPAVKRETLKAETGRPEPRVVVIPLLQKPEDRFSPVVIGAMTGAPNGLKLKTAGPAGSEGVAPYERIFALAAYAETDGTAEKNALLVFIESVKRPVVCGIDQIAFSDFPIKVLPNSLASFRGFLYFLCRKNPSLLLEETTFDFLSGSPLRKIDHTQALKLSTGLGRLIESGDISSQT